MPACPVPERPPEALELRLPSRPGGIRRKEGA